LVAFAWMIAVCLVIAREISPPTSLEDRLRRAVKEARSTQSHSLDLVGATRLTYNKLLIFPAGTPAAAVRALVARGWNGEHLRAGTVPRGHTLLVFADDSSVLGSMAWPNAVADFHCLGASAKPSDLLVEILPAKSSSPPAIAREAERTNCSH
jgi:hypothetical protein